jgi:hypothetical protein
MAEIIFFRIFQIIGNDDGNGWSATKGKTKKYPLGRN